MYNSSGDSLSVQDIVLILFFFVLKADNSADTTQFDQYLCK